MTLSSDPNSGAKRNIAVLITVQAVMGSQMPIQMVLASLVGLQLSPNPCLATLPVSLMMVGSTISSPLLSGFMQKFGRRQGFFVGAFAGMIAATLSGLGIYLGSFVLFSFAALFFGTVTSTQAFFRFAVSDLATEEFRPKAISFVLAGGLLPALIGPQLYAQSEGFLPLFPFLSAYVLIFVLNIAGSLIFFAMIDSRPNEDAHASGHVRSYRTLLRTPQIVVAMICAMVAHALMVLVMTSTPLAVVGCGFENKNAVDIVSSHVFAMFAPSFFTGALIARFGTQKIISIGMVILAGAGVVALAGVELGNFFGALVLLGIGWNFAYIGATNMLASSHGPVERGRVQGLNDFMVFGLVTIASFSSGALMNCSGGAAQEGWTAVNLAMIPFLALAGSALIWFGLNRPRKTG